MGNKIITEKDFWMCTGGNVPAQLQSMQRTTQTKEGEKYITIIDTSTTCYIDFGCKKLMLIMAIVAAVIAVAVVATGGAALIAIGALAGAAGAAFGAVMGGLICGQVAKMARVWLGSKSNMIVQGKPAITSGHKMKCMLFGDEITHAPHIKNYWQAVSLAGGNYTGGILEGMMAGAAVGMGGAFIGGGRAAFLEGGTKAVGQAALEFLKVMPKNFGLNAIESFSKFGLGMRGVMGAQNTATTYGTTGTASIEDFAKGTVAMETGAYDSFNNIKEGKGTWQDFVGMAMMVAPVGKGKRDLENEISKKADEETATRAIHQEGEGPRQSGEFEAFEADAISNKVKGDIGEAHVIETLKAEGYTDVVQIQNNSGHGVDVIARNPLTGDVKCAEVKANSSQLSVDQRLGGEIFVKTRLNRAIEGEAYYRVPPNSKQMKIDANKAREWIENADNVSYEVHRPQVDNVTGEIIGETKVDNWDPKLKTQKK